MSLVEVLIATSLGAILIGTLTFVWMQSTRIYVETVERLDTYENMRRVLDVLERDLANCSRTASMEFWKDSPQAGQPPNGRYDAGEEFAGPNAIAPQGLSLRAPWQHDDPLKLANEPEFSKDAGGGDDLNDMTAVPYIYGPTILSPKPYKRTLPEGEEAHWRDEIYVRSLVSVAGVSRAALVHYRLCKTASGRPSLRRRVWFLGPDGAIDRAASPTDVTTVLADGVTDLKFAFFLKPSPIAGSGRWYHVRPDGPVSGDVDDPAIKKLVEADQSSQLAPEGWRFAPARSTALVGGISASLVDQFHGTNAVSFHYEGWGKLEHLESAGVRFRTIKYRSSEKPSQVFPWPPDLFGQDGKNTPSNNGNFDFPGVRAGDQVFIYDAQDDDQNHMGSTPGDALDEQTARRAVFPDAFFTVAEVISEAPGVVGGNGKISLRFAEQVDFYRLKSWLGKEADPSGSPILCGQDPDGKPNPSVNGFGIPGLKRTILGSFDARYRIGFLPSALLVRLCYDDRRHHRVIPIERVIRLTND